MTLLKLHEVAEMFQVSTHTVKGWLSHNKIPATCIFVLPNSSGRGTRRFIRQRLEDWANGCL